MHEGFVLARVAPAQPDLVHNGPLAAQNGRGIRQRFPDRRINALRYPALEIIKRDSHALKTPVRARIVQFRPQGGMHLGMRPGDHILHQHHVVKGPARGPSVSKVVSEVGTRPKGALKP